MAGLYTAIGGRAGCLRLSTAFYARVDRDPLLRPLFPGTTLRCAIEAFAAFLAQVLGGPGEDTQSRWWLSLRESHMRFRIGKSEREAWLANMALALDEAVIAEPLRAHLADFFERSSAHIVNHGEAVVLDQTRRVHHPLAEICRPWEAQAALDEAVAAIRAGDADRAVALADGPALKDHGPSVMSGLLALMVRSRHREMLDYASAKLTRNPVLVNERYAGRTLLHEAAAAGSPAIVKLLLSLGADPDAPDGGGHTPLYCVGNECAVEGAESVVRMLVQAGADVNAHGGVTRCTPLHMAARRGNVEVAKALLDCGAELEARDKSGATPLTRSTNCNKVEVASLLRARGTQLRVPARSHNVPKSRK